MLEVQMTMLEVQMLEVQMLEVQMTMLEVQMLEVQMTMLEVQMLEVQMLEVQMTMLSFTDCYCHCLTIYISVQTSPLPPEGTINDVVIHRILY